jgi:hypothetical protein
MARQIDHETAASTLEAPLSVTRTAEALAAVPPVTTSPRYACTP